MTRVIVTSPGEFGNLYEVIWFASELGMNWPLPLMYPKSPPIRLALHETFSHMDITEPPGSVHMEAWQVSESISCIVLKVTWLPAITEGPDGVEDRFGELI